MFANRWMRSWMLISTLAFAPALGAQNILYFDGINGTSPADALDNLGHAYTTVTSGSAFNAAMTDGTIWDLVVVAYAGAGFDYTNLINYIDAGGRAFVSFNNFDDAPLLREAFDVAIAVSFTTPHDVFEAIYPSVALPQWRMPNVVSQISVSGVDDWADNGDYLTPNSDGLAIGESSGGFSLVLRGNGGRTIALGHELDSLDTAESIAFLENCFAYLLQKFVLLFKDYGDATSSASVDALDAEGLVYTRVGYDPDFVSLMSLYIDWDVVVVDVVFNSMSSSSVAALRNHVNSGGKALLTYWNLDAESALAGDFGVTATTSFFFAQEIHGWPAVWPQNTIWTTPNTLPATISTTSETVFDSGDRLTASTEAESVGGFTATPFLDQGAVVLANHGNTICIGHVLVEHDQPAVTDLVQNCLHYLCNPPCRTLVFDSGSGTALRDALRAAKLPFVRVSSGGDFDKALGSGYAWDYVVVHNPSLVFDPTRLVQYINNGGRALVSYWNLDAEPDLQTALEIGGAIDFFDPMQISNWNALTPIWQHPNPIAALLPTTSTHTDNGDFLTALDGAAAGGFVATPTAGMAGVVIAHGGDTICIGHELDGLEAGATTDFLENCLRLQCPPPPQNDDCADAKIVTSGVYFGTLIGATSDAISSCDPTAMQAPDIWFEFTPPENGTLHVSTCGTHDQYGVDDGVNTVLSLFNGCGGTEVACENDEPTECGLLDGSTLRDSHIVQALSAGQTVLIRVARRQGSHRGPIVLNVGFNPAGTEFRRGDANTDGAFDVSDTVYILNRLFVIGSPPFSCRKTADANDDGGIDIADGVYALNSLFAGGPPPPPPTACGLDPTADGLDCGSYAPCP
ncbi:MAG: hypothetical protein ACKVX7_16700 [Planctomycetota bacterium]